MVIESITKYMSKIPAWIDILLYIHMSNENNGVWKSIQNVSRCPILGFLASVTKGDYYVRYPTELFRFDCWIPAHVCYH